jgi:hypothetical protein
MFLLVNSLKNARNDPESTNKEQSKRNLFYDRKALNSDRGSTGDID